MLSVFFFFSLESFRLLVVLPIESWCLTIIILVPAKHLESEFAIPPEIESEPSRLRAVMGGHVHRQWEEPQGVGDGERHWWVPRGFHAWPESLAERQALQNHRTWNIHASLHQPCLP